LHPASVSAAQAATIHFENFIDGPPIAALRRRFVSKTYDSPADPVKRPPLGPVREALAIFPVAAVHNLGLLLARQSSASPRYDPGSKINLCQTGQTPCLQSCRPAPTMSALSCVRVRSSKRASTG